MDTAQWPQDIGVVKPLEERGPINSCNRPMSERRARPQKEQALNCPRCNSTNTKFCYYNNYSLTQPRYFCKGCRRYWTEGGTLRNVPVGGGSRKNKRSSTSSSSASSTSTSSAASSKHLPDLNPPSLSHFSNTNNSQNPKIHEAQDLNLAFPQFLEVPKIENNNNQSLNSSTASMSISSISALELLRSGIASRGLNSYMPMPMPMPDSNTLYSPGFPFQELKPSLNFSVNDGVGSRYGGVEENIGAGGRVLFPLGGLKQISSTAHEVDHNQNKGQGPNSTGYWNGMLGGTGSW